MASQEKLRFAYDTAFFDDLSDGSFESAKVVLPIVQDLVKPTSILDVGCGTGAWLAEWISLGVTDVIGIDGHYVDKSKLLIAPELFIPIDLQQPFSVERKFDLVQCLELAEHLDAAHADQFVESLSSHGKVVLFSAAIPGQGGTHHVNEQWLSYWIEKFAKVGFQPYDIIRPRIWNDRQIEVWYRQNILIFSKECVFEDAAPSLMGSNYNVIHPEMWDYANNYELHPREVLLSLPGALSVLFQYKLGALRKRFGLTVGADPRRRANEASRRAARP